jgi:hypothetical protein
MVQGFRSRVTSDDDVVNPVEIDHPAPGLRVQGLGFRVYMLGRMYNIEGIQGLQFV